MQRLVRPLARSRVIIYFTFLTAMHNLIDSIIESRGDFSKKSKTWMLITRSTEAEAKTEKQEQSLGPYNNNITFYSHIQ